MTKKALKKALNRAWNRSVWSHYQGEYLMSRGHIIIRGCDRVYFTRPIASNYATDAVHREVRRIRKEAIRAAATGGNTTAMERLAKVALKMGYKGQTEWRDLVTDLVEEAGLDK